MENRDSGPELAILLTVEDKANFGDPLLRAAAELAYTDGDNVFNLPLPGDGSGSGDRELAQYAGLTMKAQLSGDDAQRGERLMGRGWRQLHSFEFRSPHETVDLEFVHAAVELGDKLERRLATKDDQLGEAKSYGQLVLRVAAIVKAQRFVTLCWPEGSRRDSYREATRVWMTPAGFLAEIKRQEDQFIVRNGGKLEVAG